jgi:hypothetical protein
VIVVKAVTHGKQCGFWNNRGDKIKAGDGGIRLFCDTERNRRKSGKGATE